MCSPRLRWAVVTNIPRPEWVTVSNILLEKLIKMIELSKLLNGVWALGTSSS